MSDELARHCARAVHVITSDGRILRAGRATLYILGQIGWPRLARVASRRPVVWLVEAGYWTIARTRGFWSGLLVRAR